MNLRRQLLLISLLALILPWAGCQFIRETESALREGQQQMLSGTAQAIADSLAQFPDQFDAPRRGATADTPENQLYGHPLISPPLIDGYFDDWALAPESLASLRSADGAVTFALGVYRQSVYLYVDVRDNEVVYSMPVDAGSADEPADRRASPRLSDVIELVSTDGAPGPVGPSAVVTYTFAAEAPGSLVASRSIGTQTVEETRISAHWQDTAHGYRLEARVPRRLLGARLGLVVANADHPDSPAIRVASFEGDLPGRFVTRSPLLQSVAAGYVQPDVRLIVTDNAGWRLAQAEDLSSGDGEQSPGVASGWLRMAYNALLESGSEAELAEPDPSGREQQDYIRRALSGEPATSWFRSTRSGRAVVAVAQPIWSGNVQTGAIVLQQGTEAILSLTNRALARLMNVTLIATLMVAAALLGYASWLSLRIRRLSNAAERALDDKRVQPDLPSAAAADEIGDLSRSFSSVLRRLAEYNEYLRTLASKLSHEMRTPLTIVTSSLENLEHEPLTEEAAKYTARAKDGAARLHRILSAMSEASRVEELIENAMPETFDLQNALSSTIAAYADAWPERRFSLVAEDRPARLLGSPELIIQMLDKLVDNAVGFSAAGDQIEIRLSSRPHEFVLSVTNPGPPLPARMRSQLFDSMVSLRADKSGKHLGLGLFIARLIAEGHGGSIAALDVEGGVTFEAHLPTGLEAGQ
jgi:two-component system, OmpR family, sensor histidine kinase ChvG